MVYVSPLYQVEPNKYWKHEQAAYLFGDNLKELQNFAWLHLNLTPCFYWPDALIPHYKVTEGKRWKALNHGAIELRHEEMAERIAEAREAKKQKVITI